MLSGEPSEQMVDKPSPRSPSHEEMARDLNVPSFFGEERWPNLQPRGHLKEVKGKAGPFFFKATPRAWQTLPFGSERVRVFFNTATSIAVGGGPSVGRRGRRGAWHCAGP